MNANPHRQNLANNAGNDANNTNDANDANDAIANRRVNNDAFRKIITRLVTPQNVNSAFEEEFFNGAEFHVKDNFESLISSSAFP